MINRKTLFLTIPVSRTSDADNPEVIFFHVPPMPDEIHKLYGADLIRAWNKVYAMDSVEMAMHGYMSFVQEALEERLPEAKAQKRYDAIEGAIAASFFQHGSVMLPDNGYQPLDIGKALDDGLIEQYEFDNAMSTYGFFSEALLSPVREWAKNATTTKTRQEFSASIKSALISSSTASEETETSQEKEIPAFTDSLTAGQESDVKNSGESARSVSATGFSSQKPRTVREKSK